MPETKKLNNGSSESVTWEMFQKVCTYLELTDEAIKSCEVNHLKYNTVRDTINRHTAAGDMAWSDLWELSKQKYKESITREVKRRGVEGWDEPVFGKDGKRVGWKRVYDTTLLVMEAKRVEPAYNPHASVAIVDDRPIGGMDIYTKLSLRAQKAIRDIIQADLDDQRQRTAVAVEVTGNQLLEGPDA